MSFFKFDIFLFSLNQKKCGILLSYALWPRKLRCLQFHLFKIPYLNIFKYLTNKLELQRNLLTDMINQV